MKPTDILLARDETIAVAESLTGGAVCSTLVETEGISAILLGGVVSYTNEIKHKVLGVDGDCLDSAGPVCAQVAIEMARGVQQLMGATHAVSTTGVAGPGPADGHDAGTVWIGRDTGVAHKFLFPGNRVEVRALSVLAAIYLLADAELPDDVAKYHRKVETWK